ncbi:uncharacterized protein [Typha latifolia]
MPGEKGSVCYNAMISGYAKNRRFQDAINLLNVMPYPDFVSWNAVLAGYTQNEEMGLALKFFNEMPRKDVVSWNLMVDGYVLVGDLESALEFFRRIQCPNVVSWVTMLNGYCKASRIIEATELFDQMPERNVVAWNAMIAGYVQNLQVEEAYKLFLAMPEKNSISWTTMINGYVRIGKLDEAKKLLYEMPFCSVAAQTAMMNGYVQSMKMDDAHQIFEQIRARRDVVCWNTMIAGYAQCGRMDEAMKLFHQMPRKDVVSWNIMMAGYAQNGKMHEALHIFKQMTEKNTVSWNSIISGFTQNGFYAEALEYFMLMRKEGKRPDWSTFACGLSACANLAALQVGKQLHNLLLKTAHIGDFFAGNALITTYARCGRILQARQIFDEMTTVDLISWNALIAGYASNGYGREAISLFQEMGIYGIAPDEVTFVGVLSACNHAGLIDEGLHLFKSMNKDYSIKPVAEHYACIVDLLSRAGRLVEAFELVQGMPIKANAGIWGALLGACRIHKNQELAKFAAEKLFELEPHKTSNYVLLSNINAEAGRWDEVERMRVLIKERGVLKQAGRSWIEIKNKICAFSSDDSAQPRTEEVCRILEQLTAMMRNIGLMSESTLLDCG